MKVRYSPKAIEFIKSNNIENIYLRPRLAGGCCSVSSVVLDISTKTNNSDGFIKDTFDGIKTNYDPELEVYLKSNPEIDISVIGFGKFKKLVTQTELPSIMLN